MSSLNLSQSQILCETNRRLRQLLDRILSPNALGADTPDLVLALLSEVSTAGSALCATVLPALGSDPELDPELLRYRSQVELLETLLPSLHSHLLIERARLEAQRVRIQSAIEWARASRQTL